MNKTCGQCRHCKDSKSMGMCEQQKLCLCPEELPACSKFEPKVVTNGDKIIAGGMRAIAEFVDKVWKCPCEFCVYAKYIEDYGFGEGGFDCKKPDEKDCVDGFEAWLNAPAGSEGKDEP